MSISAHNFSLLESFERDCSWDEGWKVLGFQFLSVAIDWIFFDGGKQGNEDRGYSVELKRCVGSSIWDYSVRSGINKLGRSDDVKWSNVVVVRVLIFIVNCDRCKDRGDSVRM